jgi:hypothetical protein
VRAEGAVVEAEAGPALLSPDHVPMVRPEGLSILLAVPGGGAARQAVTLVEATIRAATSARKVLRIPLPSGGGFTPSIGHQSNSYGHRVDAK